MAKIDAHVAAAYAAGQQAGAETPNPHLGTSTTWEAFEVGRYLAAVDHPDRKLIRQAGSKFTVDGWNGWPVKLKVTYQARGRALVWKVAIVP